MIGRYMVDKTGQAWLLPFDGGEALRVDRDPVFEAEGERTANNPEPEETP